MKVSRYSNPLSKRLRVAADGTSYSTSMTFRGEYDRAIELLYERWNPELADAINEGYQQNGANGYWQAWREYYDRIEQERPDFFYWRHAVVRAKVGDTEGAIDILEKGFHQRQGAMAYLRIYPLQPLYGNSRFQSLMQRMGLTDDTQVRRLSACAIGCIGCTHLHKKGSYQSLNEPRYSEPSNRLTCCIRVG